MVQMPVNQDTLPPAHLWLSLWQSSFSINQACTTTPKIQRKASTLIVLSFLKVMLLPFSGVSGLKTDTSKKNRFLRSDKSTAISRATLLPEFHSSISHQDPSVRDSLLPQEWPTPLKTSIKSIITTGSS